MTMKFSWDSETGAKTELGEIIYFGPREYITFVSAEGKTLLLTHLFDYEDREDVSAVWFPESGKWGKDEEGEAITPAEKKRIQEVVTSYLTQDDIDGDEAAANEVLWEPDGPYGPIMNGEETASE